MTEAPEQQARRDGIEAALHRATSADGSLRFDRFLEVALYDPEWGYYTHGARAIGSGGDFYTAAQVGPLLGATLARRIRTEYERLGRPPNFRIVEMGAGDGALAAAVVEAMAADPLLRQATCDYVVVETSPSLSRQLHERTARAAHPPGLRWRSATALASDGPFAGVVLANEFLDALPSRRLVAVDGTWHEQGVRRDPYGWAFVDLGPADPIPAGPLPAPSESGQVAEVSVLAEGFMREIADHLVRGCAILLDYGDEGSRLRAQRPTGTLTAFREHRVWDDPLAEPGSADLSAFVDFARVQEAATRAGLTVVSFGGQAMALGSWGLGEIGREWIDAAGGDAVERVRRQLLLKNLSFGFPNFRILELRAGG